MKGKATKLSDKLLQIDGNGYWPDGTIIHHCPACDTTHPFAAGAPFRNGHVWTFDGNVDKPSMHPSMNISIGPYPEGTPREGETDRCHYWLKNGHIEYCGDSTHAMAGKTVALPDMPDMEDILKRYNHGG